MIDLSASNPRGRHDTSNPSGGGGDCGGEIGGRMMHNIDQRMKILIVLGKKGIRSEVFTTVTTDGHQSHW